MKTASDCLAINLKRLRKENGLTQEGLAEESGLSLSTVQLIETKKRWPEKDTLSRLADALEISESSLFLDPDAKPSIIEALKVVNEALGFDVKLSKLKKR